MKIGIDISQIVYQGTGVATYTQKLVENLLRIDRKNQYLLFGSSFRQKKYLSSLAHSITPVYWSGEKKIYSLPPIFLEYLWNRLHIFSIDTLIGKSDVFHSSDWLQPPTKAKKVTTIHDLTIYKHPESFISRGGHDIVLNQKRRLSWVKRECDRVIVDSKATERDVIEILKIPKEKLRVIYLAADKNFRPQKIKKIEKVKRKYKIKKDYLLAVGTYEPRKNFKRVVEAFRLLDNKKLELVIVGKFGWGKLPSDFKHQTSNIKFLGFVPTGELPALYSGSSCFVYPSLYEGFGLPVLEAMACGCPVVTSGRGSLLEIAQNTAVLVDPLKTEDIAKGIARAVEEREVLREKGLKKASQFSWEKTACQTLEVYQELAKKN